MPALALLALASGWLPISGCALTSASSNKPTPSALIVGTPTLPQAQVQSGYLGVLTASGGVQPYTWKVASGSLPAGLALTASTGTISGTPTETGTSAFTVEVRDTSSPVSTATAAVAMSVIAEPNLQASGAALPSGFTQVSYTANLSANGGTRPYSWALTSGQLPAGLSLSSSGAITGIPASTGQSNFAAQVTDSSTPTPQSATANFQITIATLAPGAYASRTDFNLIPLPVPLPNVGGANGAGACITEPGYNNLVCRATDIATLGSSNANLQEFSTCCGGWADFNAWNANSTMFFVQTNGGGVAVMSFDPATQTIKPLYGKTVSSSAMWSHNNPAVAYTLLHSPDPVIGSLTFSSQTTPPQPVAIADLGTLPNCVPSLAGTTNWEELSVSRDEQTFVVAAGTGAEDSANYAIVYNRTKGCRWYNTQTGQIGGSWGPIGQATTADSYTLHSVRISGDGQTVFLGAANSTRHFWTIASLEVDAPGAMINTGHFTTGYLGMINTAGSTADSLWCKLGMAYRTFADPANPTFIIPAVAQCGDTGVAGDDHSSWNNDDTSDDQPFFTSTVTTPFGTPISSAWQNEVLGFSRTSPGTVWRFLSTYSTGMSQFFTCQQRIGTVSQDGKWFIFSSDWGNTLGVDSAGNHRCDVFVGQLK